MAQQLSEQLQMNLGVYPTAEVDWKNVELKKKFRPLIGRSIVHVAVNEEGSVFPKFTRIPVEDISELTDPNLRYALRFQAAVDSVGMVDVGDGSSYSDFVSVSAIGEGRDAIFASAHYSGYEDNGVDSFLETLKMFEPESDADN